MAAAKNHKTKIQIATHKGEIHPRVRNGWLDAQGGTALAIIVIILAVRLIAVLVKLAWLLVCLLVKIAYPVARWLALRLLRKIAMTILAWRAFNGQ